MRLLPDIEAAWQKFEAEAREKGADVQSENTTTYTQRDSASDDWQTRGKLVRLDHVLMAAHIMAARYSYQGVSKVWLKVLRGVTEKVTGFIAGALAKKLAGGFISRTGIGTFVNLVVQTLEEVPLQIALESAVRTASLQVRSDIYRRHMGAKGKRRRRATKVVLTRHEIPKQRRPNKSWRSPKL